jgi:hypothetical protein
VPTGVGIKKPPAASGSCHSLRWGCPSPAPCHRQKSPARLLSA